MKPRFLLLLLLAGLAQAKAQFCFNPKTAYPVGIYPSSLCTADFNGDSILDLAVANRTGTVSVLLGNGTGGFDTASYFNVGYLPYSICTADFNNDSIADLATANRGPWDISVIFGDGTGGFGTDSTLGASNPTAVLSADFNRDGKADLAVAHYGVLLIFIGDGAGGFAAPTGMTVSSGISAITTADFNNDTIPDLAVANGNSMVSVLLGNVTGGFFVHASYVVDTGPLAIISMDFNHDGKVDLATANRKNNVTGNVSVLLSTGNGNFGAATNFSVDTATVPFALCSADFDDDNEIDLAVAVVTGNNTGNVSVLKGNGAGGFGTPDVFAVDFYPNSVITADFNQDGKMDLALVTVISNNDTGYVDVLLNCNLTGINEIAENNNPLLGYPNPNNGIFSVELNGVSQGAICGIEIYNVLGERVYTASNLGTQTLNEINMSNQPAGMYLAKMTAGGKMFTQKIILQ